MTDQNIAVDKVEEVRDLHRDAAKMTTITDAEREIHQHVADAMEALLLTTTRPTLADMTSEERAECQWMQADTEQWGRLVITDPSAGVELAVMLDREGNRFYGDIATVTPRPDLPRMEWPGEQKPSPALPEGWRLADHPRYGRVIVTTPTPDYEGYIYYMYSTDAHPEGYDWDCRDAAELTFIDTPYIATTNRSSND